MNKILVWLGVAISVVSCSKSVEIEGSIKNANPLERLEVIEMASANTLPIVNAPIDKNGHFKMEFEIPKKWTLFIDLWREHRYLLPKTRRCGKYVGRCRELSYKCKIR